MSTCQRATRTIEPDNLPKEEHDDIEQEPRTPASDSNHDDDLSHLEPLNYWPSRPEYLDRELSQQNSIRSQSSALNRTESIISRIRSRPPIPAYTHPLSKEKTPQSALVTFDGPDDPLNPINWPFRKKVITTALYGFCTMGSTWASSVYSPGIMQVARDFGVGNEVSTLGLSLLLMGFATGPLIWAPLSEIFGRKYVVLTPYFVAAMFSFGTATAKDIQTVLITRFFTGFFGSAPVTNTGGVLGDIWSADQRGIAMVGYAMAVVAGAVIGPIAGAAICQSSLGWRWTEYITGILMCAILFVNVLVLDESFGPVVLVRKARRLRYETGNWALHAKHEEWDVGISELFNKYLIRPVQLIMTPICFLVALYASFVYGLLYAQLGAFPIEFEEIRGWNMLVGSLPFLAMLLGILIAAAANIFNQSYYLKRFKANNNRPVPEARLPPMMVGSVVFTAGLFLFAWTSDPTVFWLAPCIGIVMSGFGFFTIFQASLNYLVDSFQRYAASAVAANTFLRSIFAAAFPLFITPLLHNLGVGWGVSIFGFVSAAMIPIPYLFFVYGKLIRARGYWSKESVYN